MTGILMCFLEALGWVTIGRLFMTRNMKGDSKWWLLQEGENGSEKIIVRRFAGS